jgi:hypothetical protein
VGRGGRTQSSRLLCSEFSLGTAFLAPPDWGPCCAVNCTSLCRQNERLRCVWGWESLGILLPTCYQMGQGLEGVSFILTCCY